MLYVTHRPYELAFPTAIDELVYQVPVSGLSTSPRRLDALASRSFEPTTPFRLLRTFLTGLLEAHDDDNAGGLARIALELLDVALASLDGVHRTTSPETALVSVKQFIREHANDAALDPAAIAAAFHISLRHLYNLFAETGQSPADMIREARVDRAKRLLVTELHRPIASIAHECGFSDPTTFTRTFKAKTGLGPGAYRRKAPVHS